MLISGPAGTGKTLPIVTFLHCLCCDEQLRVLFLRATRKSLTESVLVTYEQEVISNDSCEHLAETCGRDHRSVYRYPSGSEIVCAGLDAHPERVLSTAWDIIFCNEVAEIRLGVWETLASRLKRPGRDPRFGWLIGDTNPCSPDHWAKKRCDEGKCEHWETTHKANPRMWNGEAWTLEGLASLDQLGNLTGVRRKRLLQGLWVAGEGVWFDTFDPEIHCRSGSAQYDRNLPVHVSIDTGLRTGAVIFQLHKGNSEVHVLGDYFIEDRSPPVIAKEINTLCGQVAPGAGFRVVSCDSAGDSRTGSGGPVITAEYIRAGLHNANHDLLRWPKFPGCVTDGLNLIEAFIGGGEGESAQPAALFLHPRCKHTKAAFENYQRASVSGVLMDYPKDPQHPYEEMIDALRGGLRIALPEGRKPKCNLPRTHASRVF